METKPTVRIVSCNRHGEALVASAARISTTRGSALEIFEDARDSKKNAELIKRVLRSGHCSTLEHAVFTLALWNVSAFVEQFFIEFRLASFTVKSRRYVDFSGQGYHIPAELEGERRALYCRYMDGLFAAYGALLERGVPREDARFLLPYAFHSSFYCTLNARELVHLLEACRARGIPELLDLAAQLEEQLRELLPDALALLKTPAAPAWEGGAADGCALIGPEAAGGVKLLQFPAEPERLLDAACRAACPGGAGFDPASLVRAPRPRELEQLNYTLSVSDLSLAGLTHLTRHRMQSVLIPPLERIGRGRQILPDSVRSDGGARAVYESALEEAFELRTRMTGDPVLRRYGYYTLTAGTLVDVMTTMNARELLLFIRLRSCRRAQWEIRNVALRALEELRPAFPALFSRFGPACYLTGKCPEGALSCGQPQSEPPRAQ